MKNIKEFLPEGKFGDFLARAQGRTQDNFAKVFDGTNPIVSYKGPHGGKPMMMPLKRLTQNLPKPEHKKALKALFKTRKWTYNKITYHLWDGDEWQQKKMLNSRSGGLSGGANTGHAGVAVWDD